jgi:hypothetical protein
MAPLLLHTSRCLAGTAHGSDARDKKGIAKVRHEVARTYVSLLASSLSLGPLPSQHVCVSIKLVVACTWNCPTAR